MNKTIESRELFGETVQVEVTIQEAAETGSVDIRVEAHLDMGGPCHWYGSSYRNDVPYSATEEGRLQLRKAVNAVIADALAHIEDQLDGCDDGLEVERAEERKTCARQILYSRGAS